jgi:hypothetical protein
VKSCEIIVSTQTILFFRVHWSSDYSVFQSTLIFGLYYISAYIWSGTWCDVLTSSCNEHQFHLHQNGHEFNRNAFSVNMTLSFMVQTLLFPASIGPSVLISAARIRIKIPHIQHYLFVDYQLHIYIQTPIS